MFEKKSGFDPSSLHPINLTIGILTNIASTILEHHVQKLEGTFLGKALKIAGLVEPDFYDRLHKLITLTLQEFFENYGGYRYQEIVDFFKDSIVSKSLANSILDDIPTDTQLLEDRLRAYLSSVPQAEWQLSPKRIIGEFLDTYRHVRRKHLSTAQVALLEAIKAGQADVQASQELLERLYARIEYESSIARRIRTYFRKVDLDDYLTASAEKVHDFYMGRYPLKWEIIKANAIVKRDQNDEILETLRSIPKGLEIICIAGQMGDGKSSFAWEIALQVAQNLGCWLLHASNRTPEAWFLLENAILDNERKPVVVLVDDMFRNESYVQALEELRTDLPIRLITTSRLHEIPENIDLPRFEVIELLPPSDYEKTLVLQKLGIEDLTSLQKSRLKTANNWLILMFQVVSGDTLGKVVKDNIQQLKKTDINVYQAFEYICFAGQFDILFPEELLSELNGDGYFYKLAEKKSMAGLVFAETSTQWGNCLRPSHALIARESLVAYGRDPYALLRTIFQSSKLASPVQRQFLQRVLLALIMNDQKEPILTLIERHSERFWELIASSPLDELLTDVADFLKKLEDAFWIKQILDQALISSSVDMTGSQPQKGAYLALVKDVGTDQQVEQSVDRFHTWLHEHENDRFVRSTYLSLIRVRGTSIQAQRAISETRSWLNKHDDDLHIRTSYIALVRDRGTPEHLQEAIENVYLLGSNVRFSLTESQTRKIIDTTYDWLKHHDNHHVRKQYFEKVHEFGTATQIELALEAFRKWFEGTSVDEQAQLAFFAVLGHRDSKTGIQMASAWLEEYGQAVSISAAYLGIVRERGTNKLILHAIDRTSTWLEDNEQDTLVRCTYLALVRDKGTEIQIQHAIDRASAWLNKDQQNVGVWSAYLALVRDKGTEIQIQHAIDRASAWLNKDQQNVGVWSAYLALVRDKGTEIQIQRAIDRASAWVEDHDEIMDVRSAYVALVREKGTDAQIQHCIEHTSIWLANHEHDTTVRTAFLALVRTKGTKSQIEYAIDQTTDWFTTSDIEEVRRTVLRDYLKLVNAAGTKSQSKSAIEIAQSWFQETSIREDVVYATTFSMLLYKASNYSIAVDILNSVLRKQKSNVWARVTLAWCQYELGDKVRAYEELKHADWWAKTFTQRLRNLTLLNLGIYYQKQGDYENAIEHLKRASDEAPENYAPLIELGRIYVAEKRYQDAIGVLEMALTLLDATAPVEAVIEIQNLIAQAKTNRQLD